jgi:hypothetical protein
MERHGIFVRENCTGKDSLLAFPVCNAETVPKEPQASRRMDDRYTVRKHI